MLAMAWSAIAAVLPGSSETGFFYLARLLIHLDAAAGVEGARSLVQVRGELL
jgi:hypothetical protein